MQGMRKSNENKQYNSLCQVEVPIGGGGRYGGGGVEGITKAGKLLRGEAEEKRPLEVPTCAIHLDEELDGDEEAEETDDGLHGAYANILPHALYHAHHVPACLAEGCNTLEGAP